MISLLLSAYHFGIILFSRSNPSSYFKSLFKFANKLDVANVRLSQTSSGTIINVSVNKLNIPSPKLSL